MEYTPAHIFVPAFPLFSPEKVKFLAKVPIKQLELFYHEPGKQADDCQSRRDYQIFWARETIYE